MTKLVFKYWPIRGLGQRCILLMEYLGLDYQIQPVVDRQAWFNKQKPELSVKNPLINLPYLADGATVIAESWAIMVYAAHKADRGCMQGKTGQEKVEHAAIVGFFNDLYTSYVRWSYGKSEDLQKGKAEIKKDLDVRLAKLDTLSSGRKWIVGETFTLADILIYDFLSIYEELLCPGDLKAFKNLLEYYHRVGEIETIKKYRSSDRFNKEPCNGPSAQFSPLKVV